MKWLEAAKSTYIFVLITILLDGSHVALHDLTKKWHKLKEYE